MIGQMPTCDGTEEASLDQFRRTGKLDKISAGQQAAYALEGPRKSCNFGQARTVTKAQGAMVVHRYKARAHGRLRVHWLPVFEGSAS